MVLVVFVSVVLMTVLRYDLTEVASKPVGLSETYLNIWRTSGLVDDLALDGAPPVHLEAVYGAKSLKSPGEKMTPKEAKDAPMMKTQGNLKCKAPYTLVMVDPDARSRSCPMYRSWLHWLVVNVEDNVSFRDGDTVWPYLPPGPPNGTGPHRYAILIYCQSKKLNPTEVKPKDRPRFDLDKFVQQNFEITPPAAGNFFYSEFTP